MDKEKKEYILALRSISKFTIYLFAFDAFLAFKKLVRDKSIEISRIYIQISDGMVSRQGRFSGKGTRTVELVTLPLFFAFFRLHNPKKVNCETTDVACISGVRKKVISYQFSQGRSSTGISVLRIPRGSII